MLKRLSSIKKNINHKLNLASTEARFFYAQNQEVNTK